VYRPGWQLVQFHDPSSAEKVPEGQTKGLTRPLTLANLPAGLSRHEVRPTLGWYWPLVHGLQLPERGWSWNLPEHKGWNATSQKPSVKSAQD
jgi:hypothetical protein